MSRTILLYIITLLFNIFIIFDWNIPLNNNNNNYQSIEINIIIGLHRSIFLRISF